MRNKPHHGTFNVLRSVKQGRRKNEASSEETQELLDFVAFERSVLGADNQITFETLQQALQNSRKQTFIGVSRITTDDSNFSEIVGTLYAHTSMLSEDHRSLVLSLCTEISGNCRDFAKKLNVAQARDNFFFLQEAERLLFFSDKVVHLQMCASIFKDLAEKQAGFLGTFVEGLGIKFVRNLVKRGVISEYAEFTVPDALVLNKPAIFACGTFTGKL